MSGSEAAPIQPLAQSLRQWQEAAQTGKAWPFAEAQAILDRYKTSAPEKGYVLFQTGYGPSGLPHIGTFGEVARTTMVRRAFMALSDIPTRLFAFSDDMDGLRKVPTNLPNQDMLAKHIGLPLTKVPDPFGQYESFAHHNNARLRDFLDGFGFDYEFKSSTECYKAGVFDAALKRMFDCYDDVMKTILPTLGDERQQSYSIFFPISPKTGRVLQVPIKELKRDSYTVVFEDEDGTLTELPITGGNVKMQWKPDWALRWYAFQVDFEMYGKDLISSAELADKFVQILGGTPPVRFQYEMFNDEQGQKISKSKGNGIAIEDWLKYASPESLALYNFHKPKSAKKLHFDVIPRAVDDYLTFVEKFPEQSVEEQINNPAWHIHGGQVPANSTGGLSFNILLNLASVASAEDAATIWKYIEKYAPGTTRENAPYLDQLVGYAVQYYLDFIKPNKVYRAPTELERTALADLDQALAKFSDSDTAEDIQNEVYEVGKRHAFPALKAWFDCLYQVLLGQETGPRMGSFIKLYGIDNTRALIRDRVG